MRKLLTLTEVSLLLRVSPITVRRWIKKGKLSPLRVGRKLLFREEEIEKLLKEGK